MTDVRVGIVVWNTVDDLRRCLDALPDALDDLDAEVVVVDNASHDGSADVAEAAPGVRVIRSPVNVGYARAMNRALGGTDAPALIALNPDTVPRPGSLARLVAVLDEHPEVGLVAPRLVWPDGRPQHSVHRFPSWRLAVVANLVPAALQTGTLGARYWLEGRAPHDRPATVDWTIGAVHVLRSAALPGAPPYRERWFVYVEDLDLCWRLHHADWEVRFEPSATVVHRANAAGEQAFGERRVGRYLRETYDWYAEVHGVLAVRVLALLNLIGSLVKGSAAGLASVIASRGRDRRALSRRLLRTVPLHVQVVVRGRPRPAAPPPG